MTLLALEILLFVCIALGVITQVIIPAFSGQPFFPLLKFRRRTAELEDARAQTLAATLEEEIERERIKTEEIRKRTLEIVTRHIDE